MNETLINNWNSVVDENDDVWVCGDFFMGPITNIEPILSRLKGKIHLVRGNHDQKNRIKIYEAHGIDIHDIAYIQYKKKLFLCTHYPMIVENGDCDKHIFNLHGHTHQHSLFSEYPRCIHVGVDSNNLTPISIEQIWNECWPQEIMTKEVQEYKDSHNTTCEACQRECGPDNKCDGFARGM